MQKYLQRGQGVDHETDIAAPLYLGPKKLLQRGDGDLHARELRGLADLARDPLERDDVSDRRDVLEGDVLVTHHVRNSIEDIDAVDLRRESAVVEPDLVRRILDGDVETRFAAPDPFAQELEGERRLAGSRRPDDQVGPVRHEAPLQHLVDLGNAERHPSVDNRGVRPRFGHVGSLRDEAPERAPRGGHVWVRFIYFPRRRL